MAASEMPRAPGLPWIGSAIELLRDPLASLTRAHAALGPIFEVRAATRRFVVLAGREANRFVGREGRDALESWSFWGALSEHRACPHAILSVDGEDHRVQRRHYADVLSRRLVDRHREGCDELVRAGFGEGQGRIDVRDQTRLLIARLVHHCLAEGAAPIPESTARALMEVFRWETNTLLLGKWPKLALRTRPYRRALAEAEAFIDARIAAEFGPESDSSSGEGWFARVRELQASHPELLGPGDLRFALLLPFVAGVDTVGATLGFVLRELYRDPQLRGRIEAEVAELYAEGVPDSARLAAAPGLHGLVLECLRLYPAAFAMYRGAARTFEFEGHLIPAGTDIVVFTAATHFDPRYFPEPGRLDVDRHRAPRLESRQKQVFMPYGGGPHVCLGAGMGEALLLLATAAIVRHHSLALDGTAGLDGRSFDPSLAVDPRLHLVRQRG